MATSPVGMRQRRTVLSHEAVARMADLGANLTREMLAVWPFKVCCVKHNGSYSLTSAHAPVDVCHTLTVKSNPPDAM